MAAKAGLAGLTRNAAHAHRFDRVRINGLDIGWTDTPGEDATQRTFHAADDGWRAAAAARLPMGRLGQVDEIADCAVFLLSDRSGTERAGADRRLPRPHARRPALVDSLVVSDAVPAVPAAVAAAVGAEAADSPGKLLTAGVDGVLVAAATDAHPALLRAAVDAGLPVFCEKPLAAGLDDARAVAAAVRGAPVQIGYPRRFDPAFVAVRAAVEAGELGRVHTVRSTTLDPTPPPRDYLARSGGLLRDCTVHDLDAVRWGTGQDVAEVYAAGSDRGDPVFGELGDVDAAALVLTMTDGSLALVSNSRYNARGYDVRLEVHGAADSRAAGLDGGLPLLPVGPGALAPAGPPHAFFTERLASAFRAELAAFAELVAGARPSPCTVDDALAVAVAAEAAVVSLREHRPVRPEEVA